MERRVNLDKKRKDSSVARLFIPRAYSSLYLNKTERELEKEIRRQSTVPPPQRKVARIRHHGELVLHSKLVLMVIVILNLLDCALVLSELVLDIHYIKERREHVELSSENFIKEMKLRYPKYIHGSFDTDSINLLYDQIVKADCTWGGHLSNENNFSQHIDHGSYTEQTNVLSNYTKETGSHNRSERSLETTTLDEHGPKYNVVRNRTLHGLDSEHSDAESHHGPNTNHHAHSIWMDIAHGMHKASICILGILFAESIVKVAVMGRSFFSKKLEVFDAVIVFLSFVIDLVFLKGLSEFKVQDAMLILSFLLPWRVIRVVNSLIVAVLDHQHFRQKMLYMEKKAIAAELKKLKVLESKWDFHLHKIEQFCESEGIPKWKIKQHTAMGRKKSTIASMASLALNGALNQYVRMATMVLPTEENTVTKDAVAKDAKASNNLTSIEEDEYSDDDVNDDYNTLINRQLSVIESETDFEYQTRVETCI